MWALTTNQWIGVGQTEMADNENGNCSSDPNRPHKSTRAYRHFARGQTFFSIYFFLEIKKNFDISNHRAIPLH